MWMGGVEKVLVFFEEFIITERLAELEIIS